MPATSKSRSSATAKARFSLSASAIAPPSAATKKSSKKPPPPDSPTISAANSSTPPHRLGQAVNYQSAGTVEFIFDADTEEFYFLEVNTRLQVEHGVTEEVTGIDLVEWMIRQAAGELPPLDSFKIHPAGASIQVRLYAEDPAKNFQPSSGILTEVTFPDAARVETWVERGTEVTAFYDPMIAKIIVQRPPPRRRCSAKSPIRARRTPASPASKPISITSARSSPAPAFRQRKNHHPFLGTFPYTPRHHRRPRSRHPNHRPGLSRPHRLLGRRRPALRPDGSPRLPHRQPPRRQSARTPPASNSPSPARPCASTSTPPSPSPAQTWKPTLDGKPVPIGNRSKSTPAAISGNRRRIQGAGVRAYLAVRGGFDVPTLSRQPSHLHPRQIRRPRRPRPAHRRCPPPPHGRQT